jgi:hypothetical protein
VDVTRTVKNRYSTHYSSLTEREFAQLLFRKFQHLADRLYVIQKEYEDYARKRGKQPTREGLVHWMERERGATPLAPEQRIQSYDDEGEFVKDRQERDRRINATRRKAGADSRSAADREFERTGMRPTPIPTPVF